MNERDTTDGVIRIEADRPAPISQPPATRVPITPVAPGIAGNAAVQTGGDDAEDLEETRAELSETLAAIEAKLSPQRLMEQAKDTVQETTDHVVAQAKHAAHEAVSDAVDHTKEAVHDATIGKVEHMVSNVTDAAKNLVGGVTGMTHEGTGASYGTGTPIAYSTSVTAPPSSGGGGSVWETIKENPIPLALAAASLVLQR